MFQPRPSTFLILLISESFCLRQNGTFPLFERNASHASQSVWRLQRVFGQGQSSLITGGTGIYSSLNTVTV